MRKIISEQRLHNIIMESVFRLLNEEANPNFTHFAVSKTDGKIVYGWDYSDCDPQDLRQFKRDYFFDELNDMGYTSANFVVLTINGCKNYGINPFDNKYWSKGSQYDMTNGHYLKY
jgi:hypothetical protein